VTRIFFTSDVHGSEKCFKKFLRAGSFYKVDVVILGGDITGKTVVPILESANAGYTTSYLGEERSIAAGELEGFMETVRDSGGYPYVTSAGELEALSSDKGKLDALFVKLMTESLDRWVKMAEEKLGGSGMQCYIMLGNDDHPDLQRCLAHSQTVVNPENRVINLHDNYVMISTGLSNPTPWNTYREVTEERLSEAVEKMTCQVDSMEKCIFNFHCPPFGALDEAPRLERTKDGQLKPVLLKGSGIELISVGSTTIRNSIEKYQPLMGLHGHIHEAKGVQTIGRTHCFNPGSEYQEGILRGVVINLDGKRVKGFVFTRG